VTTTPDWHTPDFPELRSGPPWVTDEMTAAQPGLAAPLLGDPSDAMQELATAIRRAHQAREPIAVIGCGTSEHGAMAFAALIDAALGGGWPPAAESRQSLDAAERPQRGGVCIGISHDGGTRATTLALEAAREGDAVTALVTNRPGGSASAPASLILETPLHDDSWCHTVAYTSTILAGAAVARELGLRGVEAGATEALMRAALETEPDDGPLHGAERVLCAGAGLDLITAREIALKLAEGARLPTATLQLETLLHGNLAGEDERTAAVLVQTGPGDDRVARRAAMASDALGEIGIPVAQIGPPPGYGVHPALARLLGGAIGLHRITLALAHAREVNPDLIRREEEPYRRAGSAAEGDF
jgi:glucosamine--fructose-6-phosphate aminotransferase (isomerizing)